MSKLFNPWPTICSGALSGTLCSFLTFRALEHYTLFAHSDHLSYYVIYSVITLLIRNIVKVRSQVHLAISYVEFTSDAFSVPIYRSW
jgi:hypothetical protein